MEVLTTIAGAVAVCEDERAYPGLFGQLRDLLYAHAELIDEAMALGLPHLLADCIELQPPDDTLHAYASLTPLLVLIAQHYRDTNALQDIQVSKRSACVTRRF